MFENLKRAAWVEERQDRIPGLFLRKLSPTTAPIRKQHCHVGTNLFWPEAKPWIEHRLEVAVCCYALKWFR